MKTHQMYKSSVDKGVECSRCGGWIPNGHKAVKMDPVTVGENGVDAQATAVHGVVCMPCYEEL